MNTSRRHLRILGTRGIPATHGGFETFAEHLAPYLLEKGWRVTVYCQTGGYGEVEISDWNGIRLVHIPEPRGDALGTMRFDWKSIRHACGEDGLVLTMGYNTAIFNLLFRLKRIPNIINMDGLEWKRSKWGIAAKLWFYINEWAGCFIGNHLIADHPEIENRISRKRSQNAITMIPYGAEQIESCSDKPVIDLGLTPKSYALCVARPEPENSILEIVRAFSCSHRNFKLVVLGDFQSHNNRYHASILEAASDEVLFPGALYEVETVQSLRSHCRLYIHGHTVGGTNPSLVESLAAGAPILAHDNVFNRWVAGDEQVYFSNEKACKKQLDELLVNDERLGKMSAGSLKRAEEAFAWSYILSKYENLLGRLAPPIQT